MEERIASGAVPMRIGLVSAEQRTQLYASSSATEHASSQRHRSMAAMANAPGTPQTRPPRLSRRPELNSVLEGSSRIAAISCAAARCAAQLNTSVKITYDGVIGSGSADAGTVACARLTTREKWLSARRRDASSGGRRDAVLVEASSTSPKAACRGRGIDAICPITRVPCAVPQRIIHRRAPRWAPGCYPGAATRAPLRATSARGAKTSSTSSLLTVIFGFAPSITVDVKRGAERLELPRVFLPDGTADREVDALPLGHHAELREVVERDI